MVTTFLNHALGFVFLHFRIADVAVAMLGLFIFSCVVQRTTSKGPMLWPLLGVIPTVMINKDRLYDWATATLVAGGGTFAYRGMWLGGAHGIVTVDPAKVEYILRTNAKNFPKGKYYRERFQDLLGDGIFNSDDDTWQLQRRAATSEMHSGRFSRFSSESMQGLVRDKLVKLIDSMAVSDRTVDLQEVLLRFTFDNICAAALGVDPGCLAADLPEIPFATAFEDATELTLLRFLFPPVVWKPMRWLGVGFERRLRSATRFVRNFASEVVAERRREMAAENGGGLTEKSDLLSRLMEYPEKFSDTVLADFCISFILAGRDTSSVGLAWFFWLLHRTPEVERRILEEIGGVLSERRGGEKYEEQGFSGEEVRKMVYLQAALSECLRLYPPVPIDIKEVTEDDVFPDGTAVRSGARVLYCMFSMGRMESIWGKDCLEFRPERWIDGETGRFAAESQFKYAVFNGGPRLCLGKSFAYMQMKMVAASILRRYEVKVLEGQRIVPKVTTTLYMKNGLLVSFKPRVG